MSPLHWTVKPTRNLAAALARQGHRVSADTVGDLLSEEGFSLQAGATTLEGRQHPDRDARFRYTNEQAISPGPARRRWPNATTSRSPSSSPATPAPSPPTFAAAPHSCRRTAAPGRSPTSSCARRKTSYP